jgi:hypothetical protein
MQKNNSIFLAKKQFLLLFHICCLVVDRNTISMHAPAEDTSMSDIPNSAMLLSFTLPLNYNILYLL